MAQTQCAECGKLFADTEATCPRCGRPARPHPAVPARPEPARERRQSALDREFELLCLMDDIF